MKRFNIVLASLCLAAAAVAQDAKVYTGKIVSSDGQPLEGVILSIPGASGSAVTDSLGEYSLTTKAVQGTLRVAADAYYGHEYPLFSIPKVIVMVPTDEKNYSGEVVLPSGTTTRDHAAATLSTLFKKDMQDSPSADLSWQDGDAALMVTRKSGMPGEGGYFNIRGLHSLHAENTPLIVINGVPHLANVSVSDVINAYSRDALFGYNARDIHSITVLKGAEAAMYGSLGSNGVILIETEQASSDNLETRISYQGSFGIARQPRQIPVLGVSDFKEYLQGIGQTRYASLSSLQQDYPFLSSNPGYYAYLFNNNTDWVDEISRNAFVTNNNVRVEGGDDIAKYNISFGYTRQNGTLDQTKSDRYSTAINTNIIVSRDFEIFTSVNLAYINSDLNNTGMAPETNPILSAYHAMPMLSPYDQLSDGSLINRYAKYNGWNVNSNPTYAYDNVSNPLAIVRTVEGTDKIYDANIRLGLNWRPTPHWTFTGLINLYYDYTEEYIFTPGVSDKAIIPQLYGTGENFVSMGVIRQNAYYFNLNAAYNNTFEDVHRLSAYAGARFMTKSYEYDASKGYNSANDYYKTLGVMTDEWSIFGSNDDWKILSFYAHGDYTWKDLLKFSAGITADGTSASGVDAPRFGFFPSVSATYMMANQEWMPEAYDHLNFTAELSLSGNSRFSSNYGKNYYVSNNLFNLGTIVRHGVPNTKLEWEKKLQADYGFDMSLLKNKLNIRVNGFWAKNYDLLLNREISAVYGNTDFYYDNTAQINTAGFEADIRWTPIHNRDWDWNIHMGVAHWRSTVKDLGPQDSFIQTYASYNNDDAQTLLKVGETPYQFYGYQTRGVFASTAEAQASGLKNTYGNSYQGGDVIFVDQNGDNIINDADRTTLGKATPDLYGSFGTSLQWRQWSLSADFGFSIGNEAYNATRRQTESMDNFFNQSTSVLNRWQIEGQQTSMPRAAYGDPSGNNFFSDRWIEDASYLKLRNLQLSYAFTKKQLGFASGNLWVAAENLFTLTSYLGGDPEFSYSYAEALRGFDYAKVNNPVTFKVGLNLNF